MDQEAEVNLKTKIKKDTIKQKIENEKSHIANLNQAMRQYKIKMDALATTRESISVPPLANTYYMTLSAAISVSERKLIALKNKLDRLG